MPPTREQVWATAVRRFPNEDPTTIFAILDLYGDEAYERERDRVHVAILRLSEGDVDRLLYYTRRAKMDYRDVLWWAENPEPEGPQQGPPEDTDALMEWVR